mmetsp:Transcript_17501/g.52638  ORF Transcript_17501/g.52638 Transcript_17501/m.52638 type:complete len:209 (-) Transcript_17501:1560-2186(-)
MAELDDHRDRLRVGLLVRLRLAIGQHEDVVIRPHSQALDVVHGGHAAGRRVVDRDGDVGQGLAGAQLSVLQDMLAFLLLEAREDVNLGAGREHLVQREEEGAADASVEEVAEEHGGPLVVVGVRLLEARLGAALRPRLEVPERLLLGLPEGVVVLGQHDDAVGVLDLARSIGVDVADPVLVLHAHGDGRGEVEGEHLEGPAHDAKLLR